MNIDPFGQVQPVPLLLATSQERDETVRLAVSGEVDIATVDPLREAMTAVLKDRQVTRLVVDFAEVAFLDSTGIAALMAAYRLAQAREVDFEVVRCRPQARRVIEVIGVDKFLISGDGHGAGDGQGA